MTALCSDCIVLSPLPAGGSRQRVMRSPTFRLSDLSICWLSDLSGSWRGKPEALGSALQGLVSCRWCRQRVTALCSHCKVQLLHCAITITGGWQPARYWWCARQLSNFPTCQLSNFPASRLVGLLVCWRWWGLRVCGYSEALMRVSERGCIRAAE